MKLTKHRQDVTLHGVQDQGEFSIKGSAQAFEILSSGLYSDKVLAVVRELSCNAADAHIEAGKADEPFHIHLPNRIEPHFSVSDNGIGLSHEDVMGLYSTYFDSTKDDSNDFIGAFGLGSKSPFSYSDRFEVVSRHEGMKRIYQVFINEKGIPAVALFAEAKTDEGNGLLVKLTVRNGDFTQFRDRVRTALKYFPVKPIINGGDGYFNFDALPDSAVEEDGWIAYKRSGSYYQNHDLVAIQGHVPYKVDTQQLRGLTQSEKDFVRGTQLALKFGIGELDIAASREELQYTDKSQAAIEGKIREIIQSVAQLLDKRAWKFNKLGYWEASIELNRVASTLFGRNVFKYVKETDVKCPTLKKYIRLQNRIEVNKVCELHELVLYSPSYTGRGYGRSRINVVTPENQTAVMVNDIKIGGIKRTKQFLNDSQKTYKQALLISRRRDLKVVPADTEFDKEVKKIEKLLGRPKVLRVSTATTAIPPAHKRPKVIFTFNKSRHHNARKRRWWTKEEIHNDVDISKGGFYIPLYKGTQIRDESDLDVNWSYSEVKRYLPQMLELLNIHSKDIGVKKQVHIYAVPSLSTKEVLAQGNWHNAFELTKKYVKQHATDVNFVRRFETTEDMLEIKIRLGDKWFTDQLDKLDKDSVFRKALDPMRKALATQAASKYLDLVKSFVKPPKTVQPFYKPATLQTHYPMLSFVTGAGYSASVKARWCHFFDYIQIIDEDA